MAFNGERINRDINDTLVLTYLYMDEPPPRCPQCLSHLMEPRHDYFRCARCDYRWVAGAVLKEEKTSGE